MNEFTGLDSSTFRIRALEERVELLLNNVDTLLREVSVLKESVSKLSHGVPSDTEIMAEGLAEYVRRVSEGDDNEQKC
jgi:hypothetical protein